MISRLLLRKMFRRRLATAESAYTLIKNNRVAWQNRSFEPPNPGTQDELDFDNIWIRESLVPGSEDLIATNVLEMVGMLQWGVVVPLGTGTEKAELLAEEIANRFKPAVSSAIIREEDPQSGEATIEIVSSTTLNGGENTLNEQRWFEIPVRIMFRAYGDNTVESDGA